jgi:hypothetical protein
VNRKSLERYRKNREFYLAQAKARGKMLTDSYIKTTLRKTWGAVHNITESAIQMRRKQLKLARQLKKAKEKQNASSNR